MQSSNLYQTSELLQAQAHIWNHIFRFIDSMSLKCAIQLGIPDIINNHGGPMPLSELVAALPINKRKSHYIFRLMRILVHSGFFLNQKTSKNGGGDEQEEEGYLLTPATRLLLKDERLNVRPFLLAMLDPVYMKPWQHMSEWFGNDDPTAFYTAHGRTSWEYFVQDSNLRDFFHDAMTSDTELVASVVIKECKGVFEGIKSVVDVGGGAGTMAKAIANAFPHLECISFDLPHVVSGLEGSRNLSFVGGDMFDAIPQAHVVILKWVLHNWKDEECVKILKKCKEAIPKEGGKVIIVEMAVDNKKGDDNFFKTQLFFDMLMMVILTGRQRNQEDWAKLFSDVGFSDYKVTPIGLRSLIEVYP